MVFSVTFRVKDAGKPMMPVGKSLRLERYGQPVDEKFLKTLSIIQFCTSLRKSSLLRLRFFETSIKKAIDLLEPYVRGRKTGLTVALAETF